MSLCSQDAPDPPDLVGAANATAQNNLEAARVAADANRINQYTPYGNQLFTHGTGPERDIWTSRINLTPAQQKIFDANQGISQSLLDTGQRGLNQVANAFRNPFDTRRLPKLQINPGQTAQRAIEARLNPMFDRQQAALDTQLANQGIARGSEAASNAYDDFGRQKNDAYTQAALRGIDVGQQARQQAIQEQSFLRNEPLNMVNALRTGNQATMPQFQSAGQQHTTQGADILGATNANFQNQLGAYNAKAAGDAAMMNGLFSIGAAAAGAPAGGGFSSFSDRRLKSNIVKIGEYHGHNLYEYDIFGKREIGVMAQEVMQTNPEAVSQHRSGYLMVHYGAL